MKFLNIPVFIIALSIGLFLSYALNPKANIIYVYPNPETEDKVLYKDKSDTCYKFVSKEVKCPNDITKIRAYNIQ
tara:strand:- start:142 stop:366 length:225 start_codon:yes stop_codon:yes gene_type:complete